MRRAGKTEAGGRVLVDARDQRARSAFDGRNRRGRKQALAVFPEATDAHRRVIAKPTSHCRRGTTCLAQSTRARSVNSATAHHSIALASAHSRARGNSEKSGFPLWRGRAEEGAGARHLYASTAAVSA